MDKSLGALRFTGVLVATVFGLATANSSAQTTVQLKDLTAETLRSRWEKWAAEKSNKPARDLESAADVVRPRRIELPASGPLVEFQFDLRAGQDPDSTAKKLDDLVRNNFIGQHVLGQDDAKYLISEKGRLVVTAKPAPSGGTGRREDMFSPPPGMVTPIDVLLSRFMYSPPELFPFTVENCLDLAATCYRSGYYQDAAALAGHAGKKGGQARAWLLKGVAETAGGRKELVLDTAAQLNAAIASGRVGGLNVDREKFGGPNRTRFEQIAAELARQPSGASTSG